LLGISGSIGPVFPFGTAGTVRLGWSTSVVVPVLGGAERGVSGIFTEVGLVSLGVLRAGADAIAFSDNLFSKGVADLELVGVHPQRGHTSRSGLIPLEI
jgi:hypothetical protein